MYYVYVLKSGKDCKYYIGSSGDLKRRKEEHDRGLVASTRHRRPFDLLYYEAYPTKELAEERERKSEAVRFSLRRICSSDEEKNKTGGVV
jgi:putative endonuclease